MGQLNRFLKQEKEACVRAAGAVSFVLEGDSPQFSSSGGSIQIRNIKKC